MEALIIFAMDEGERVPRGSHGGCLHVRYRLVDGGRPVPNAQITEQFTAIEDPYGVGESIQRGSSRTDMHGNFDDYVAFSYRAALPDEFRLVADQEVFANGASVARNRVTWSSRRVMVSARDGRRPPTVAADVTLR
jgi:hypothetical protein